ncbi:MAG: trigger factor [Candidatus Gastranaerophilaceae bacterium]|nr:trigger factor [Roseburia sp. CAG:303]
MSLQVEKLEKNMAKLTIEAPADEFEKAVEKSYQKNKNRMSVPGFRKGKVPRKMLEKMYGTQIFFEDAINDLIPEVYSREVTAAEDLEIVSQPKIEVTQAEAGQSFIFTAEVALKPAVELGQYKGLAVEKDSVEVTDEDVAAEIEKVRKENSRTISVEDRAVEDGDIATIDFEGFIDGEAFEGGKGTDYPLTIGSHSFIDTFEEQLVGKNLNEEVEVNVTFPEDYQAKELAGKPAMFKVTVKELKKVELPEADDEFAQDVSEFDTLEEYKNDIRTKLTEQKETEAKNALEDKAVAAVVEGAKMDIPEPMIDLQVRQMAENFARRLQSQGISWEQYCQFTGMTTDKLFEQMRPQALKTIQSRLVLEAVAAAENIIASEEDFAAEIDKMAEAYKMEADKIKEMMGEEEKNSIMKDLAVTKAAEFIVANIA